MALNTEPAAKVTYTWQMGNVIALLTVFPHEFDVCRYRFGIMFRPAKLKISRTNAKLSEAVMGCMQTVGSSCLHLLTICLLVFCIIFVNWVFGTTADQSHLHPLETYGLLGCILLYTMRCIPYLSIPFGLTNILGKFHFY